MTDLAGPRTGGQAQAAARMADLVPQSPADVTGVISSVRAMSIAGAPACRYTLTDGTGELDLLFIGRVEIAGLECGRRCRAVGTVGKRDHRLVLWNPRYWLEPTDSKPPDVLVVDCDLLPGGRRYPHGSPGSGRERLPVQALRHGYAAGQGRLRRS
jgi:hypothetical protein